MKIISNSQVIITRPGFCPECAEAERAKTYALINDTYYGDKFLAFGSNGWHVLYAKRCSKIWGMVPHLYFLHKKIGANCIVLRCCAIADCGTHWKLVDNIWKLSVEAKDYTRMIYTTEQWDALVMNPYRENWDYYI